MPTASPAPVVSARPPLSRRVPLLLFLSLSLMACGQPASVPVSASDPLHLEAEDGTIDSSLAPQLVSDPIGGGRVINDPNASGGRAVILLGTNDAVRFKVPSNFTAGRYTVKVRGRGQAYKGWPIVALENVARRRIGTATLDTAGYGVRTFGAYDLKPGQDLFFTFTNDLYEGPGKDRNAVVDYLVIEPVQNTPANQAPTVTLRPVENGHLPPSEIPDNFFEDDHNVTLEADASDPDGSVARVEFYSGDTRIGEDATAPYGSSSSATTTWTPRSWNASRPGPSTTGERSPPRLCNLRSSAPSPASFPCAP